MYTLNLVEDNKVLKCWREANMSEHMPWYSDELMESIEKTIDKVVANTELHVNATICDCGIENPWRLVVGLEGTNSNAVIMLERTEPFNQPKVSIEVNIKVLDLTVTIPDSNLMDCFRVAVNSLTI